MSALVVFAPCSVDDKANRDRSMIVVRRPTMCSYPGRAMGHVDERLGILVEAYAAGGPTECVGVDDDERPIHGGPRLPVYTEVVWCTQDERDQWDRGTGGEPGKPRSGTSGPVAVYLTAEAYAVELATRRARLALLPGAGYVPLSLEAPLRSLRALEPGVSHRALGERRDPQVTAAAVVKAEAGGAGVQTDTLREYAAALGWRLVIGVEPLPK